MPNANTAAATMGETLQ